MKIFERAGWSGLVSVKIVGVDGSFKQVTIKNHITDSGLNLMRDGLIGASADVKIRYVAVGTSNTAPADGDIVLGAEVFRKTFLQEAPLSVGQAYTQFILESDEANFNIQELGWFAGPTATAAAGSGVLVARTLFSHNKTNLESIYLDRTDTLIRS